ncbi:lipocalin family protein [Streptomyces sp. NPDC001941]|uniref:lipocalin family protein n=1 Tax=Streptomyces sp. NPDC001941 TaxID=3154659 RepID=UPI00331EF7E3
MADLLRRRARHSLACAGALTVLVATAASAAAQPRSHPAPAAAPDRVDLARYAGSWYQLASVPQLFELQCAKNVKALYTPTADGRVAVRNSCRTWLNTTSSIDGEALALDATGTRLNVSFLKTGGSYQHTRQANYVIVGLGDAYDWAVVSNDSRTAGFVLSRTPSLTPAAWQHVHQAIRAAHLDPRAFRTTRQDGGPQHTGALRAATPVAAP